jgi:exopolyphosphatase/guanosine-5'-triphosphate,3'-diphosphate pyrophosphatase
MIRSRHTAPAPALSDDGQQRAIIDIGSNTVRMVIYGGPQRAPAVLFNEKVTARLGRGVAESGKLSGKGMATALAALARFARLLELRGVTDVDTVATAAARDARNGPEFIAQVAALGLSPRLLSGEQEAEASARGVLSAFPGAAGVVADLGGGSLELIDIAHGQSTHGVSLPLGTLRLAALRADGPEKFTRRIHKMLTETDWAAHSGQVLYLVGGSLRALARFAMVQQNWPIDDPHGFDVTPDEAAKVARSLAVRARDGEMPTISGVSASRLASLPDAAALLGVLVRELKPARIVFSGWGLREGLLAQRMPADVAAQNPLIAGVSSFVDAQQAGLAAASAKVAAWTSAVAEGMGARDDALRLAATMLGLASLRSEPNLRAEQAVQWALRKRWIGLDKRGRGMLAMAVLANSGKMEPPAELLRLTPAADLRLAAGWGLATRLARRFSGGVTDVLEPSRLRIEGWELVLSLPENLRDLCTDVTIKDMRLLGEWLDLAPQKPVFVG